MSSGSGVGNAFEDQLLWMAGVIRPKVFFIKQYPEVIFPGGKPRVVEKAVPDFWVTWKGKPFLFDCKSTLNQKDLYPKKSQDHQFRSMKEGDLSGIVCGYFVEWRKGSHLWEFFQVINDTQWPFRMRRGSGNVSQDPIKGLESFLEEMLYLRSSRE